MSQKKARPRMHICGNGKFLQDLKKTHVMEYLMKYSDCDVTLDVLRKEDGTSYGWVMKEKVIE